MSQGVTESMKISVEYVDEEGNPKGGELTLEFYGRRRDVHIIYDSGVPEDVIDAFKRMAWQQPWFKCSVCNTSGPTDL